MNKTTKTQRPSAKQLEILGCMNANIEIEWGYRYGRNYGLRQAQKAAEKVAAGEWELVRKNQWKVRGPLGGLQSGWEATYRVLN